MIGARAKLALALAACLAPCAAPMAAHAQSAAELYYERGLMSTAGARCGLFDADIAAALGAAQAQARNAALRGGQSPATLDATLGRAQATATTTPCNNPDLTTAAQRVRQAFKAYAGLRAMSFPGDFASWQAVRAETVTHTAWRLSQSTSAGQDRMVFGLAGKQGQDALTVSAAFVDGQSPYAVRLVLRDPSRAPAAYIGALVGKAPLYARLPPATATRTILAQSREPTELTLLPPGATTAAVFRFPPSAMASLSALDPRESISVDFVFAGPAGDVVRRGFFEVGDFAAGVAFLRSAQR